MTIRHCPLCGVLLDRCYPDARSLRASFAICPCCGCEFGHDDDLAFYQRWVAQGSHWFAPEECPRGWKLSSQERYQIRPWPPVDEV